MYIAERRFPVCGRVRAERVGVSLYDLSRNHVAPKSLVQTDVGSLHAEAANWFGWSSLFVCQNVLYRLSKRGFVAYMGKWLPKHFGFFFPIFRRSIKTGFSRLAMTRRVHHRQPLHVDIIIS